MNFKRGLKGIGFLLIAIGIFIVVIQPFSTTGAVIDLSTAVSRIWFFIGLGLILGGFALVATSNLERKLRRMKLGRAPVIRDYYENRVNKLIKYKGDAWISQWEADEIISRLADKGYKIEYGLDNPAIHRGGMGPKVRHISFPRSSTDKYGRKKHLYLTTNPSDPRLRYAGFREVGEKMIRVKSGYMANHPPPNEKTKKYTNRTSVD